MILNLLYAYDPETVDFSHPFSVLLLLEKGFVKLVTLSFQKLPDFYSDIIFFLTSLHEEEDSFYFADHSHLLRKMEFVPIYLKYKTKSKALHKQATTQFYSHSEEGRVLSSETDLKNQPRRERG